MNTRISNATAVLVLVLACESPPLYSAALGDDRAPPSEEIPPEAADFSGQVTPPGPGALIEDERNTISIFESAAPATVFVTQHTVVHDWATRRTLDVDSGSGTGFVWDRDGHVVTNYHVVDGAQRLTVTFQDGTDYPATLVGAEPRKDIAVLRLQSTPDTLTPIRVLPSQHALRVGQKAIAIGNPFGLDHTLTTGVISALEREIPGYGGVTIRGMIQTDAAINPGNSGGPLLNSSGELIGMNTMIYSETGSSAGIGFAVPVSTVRRVVPQIIETGSAQQVGIGVAVIDDAMAARAGIRGVVIDRVLPNSPAAAAGLQGLIRNRKRVVPQDIIVRINEEEIENYDDLYNSLDVFEPGDTVAVTVERNGQRRTLNIQLQFLR